ncbi:DUF2381 family protein [Archangium sp.]|uniref:DUF2381 family protein n=1 Tax=Archangium sp. TaxID=1872627 RepID=UPI00286B9B93|nr:DUF2381 family protein [Archangium sp.]
MIPAPPLSLLVLVLLQGSSLPPSAGVDCQEVQRIELSLEPRASREVCVSPGLLTGFVFDSTVVVDLQEEPRFAQVTHGPTSISVMPPGDMEPGERLRLTARFTDEASSDSITFVLVAHVGQATRQVEVHRDKRTRESFRHEVAQERAKNQRLQGQLERLQHELELLRAECDDPQGLRKLIMSGAINDTGLLAKPFSDENRRYFEGSLAVKDGVSYHSATRVAVKVKVRNSSPEPWTPVQASLVDAKGKEWKAVRLWLDPAFQQQEQKGEVHMVVEVNAKPNELQGEVTVVLREAGPRGLSIPKVMIP